MAAYTRVHRFSTAPHGTAIDFRRTIALLAVALLAITVLLSASSAEARKHPKRKLKTFSVYNYLGIKGANATRGYNTVVCAGPTRPEPFQFGTTYCFDMPLLKKRHLKSKLLGRVQGTFTVAQQTGGAVFVVETFKLNSSSVPYKGSFSAIGLENIGLPSSKPITGGTDDFALAEGVAFTTPLTTISPDGLGNTFTWFKYRFTFH